MGTGTSSGKAPSAGQFNTPVQIAAAKNAVNGFTGKKKYQEATVTRPSDGHSIRIELSKVNHTNYWGQNTGTSSYTIYMWDDTERNEYGNPTRLFYTYGRTLSEAKKDMRLKLGI